MLLPTHAGSTWRQQGEAGAGGGGGMGGGEMGQSLQSSRPGEGNWGVRLRGWDPLAPSAWPRLAL